VYFGYVVAAFGKVGVPALTGVKPILAVELNVLAEK
jgi:hypothetical protein